MTSETGPGTTWIGRNRARVIGFWLGGVWIWDCLFIWPIWALTQKHPLLDAEARTVPVAYLVLLVAALIWASYRLWRYGVRFDGHGVTVCNAFRDSQVPWAEVGSFTDGTTNGSTWALTVMLRDGRGVTAAATWSRPGSPEFLRPRPSPAQDPYGEGGWFAVPLDIRRAPGQGCWVRTGANHAHRASPGRPAAVLLLRPDRHVGAHA